MHMLTQVLSPGMHDRCHAELAAEALGVSSKGLQRLPGGPEQQLVDHLGMQLHPAVEIVRQGKDQMAVGNRQDILLLAFAPASGGAALALRTVAIPAAMIEGNLNIAAVTPVLDATLCRCMAVQQVPADLTALPVQFILMGRIVKMVLQQLLQHRRLNHHPPPARRPGRSLSSARPGNHPPSAHSAGWSTYDDGPVAAAVCAPASRSPADGWRRRDADYECRRPSQCPPCSWRF